LVKTPWNHKKLTLQQEQFCRTYTSAGEFFGNGLHSYMECFDIDMKNKGWQKVATSGAARLLRNPDICLRINELLDDKGLNDQYVDKQLLFLITQGADFNAKLGAVKEYNRLKTRIDDKLRLMGVGGGAIEVKLVNYADPNPV